MLRIKVEVDHREFEYTNKGVTREHLNAHDLLDAMISSMKGMGLEMDMISILDYFGIEIEEVIRGDEEEDE